MLNRRQFLVEVSAAGALAKAASGQTQQTQQMQPTQLKIRQVDIIHHTHTDVGYTALPSVVRELQKRYIDVAVDACQLDRTFRWTVEVLLELDDWWRAASLARRNQLLALVKAGQMDVMALPFNQTSFLNAIEWRQMMSWIPADLWRSLNIRAAMQNDVNGFPRAGAMALLDRNVNHLLMGLNNDSGGPPFQRPAAFWWKMPDGRRLFVWLGEHYGSAHRYLRTALEGVRFRDDEKSVRAAHADFVRRLQAIEAQGYTFDRLILTFTNPLADDNGSPFPTAASFIAAWNKLGLQPRLRLTTATDAVFQMEKLVGAQIPVREGEWTDWWANGDASGPREVAASRVAKRHMAAAFSPVFGPMPPRMQPGVEDILKDLCLFDEHTWGASASISAPYSFQTLAQYAEKSDLAYRPMGLAEALLRRRTRNTIDALPEGIYAVNPAPAEISGWATLPSRAQARSLVDTKTGDRVELRGSRFWVEKLAPNSIRAFRGDTAAFTTPASEAKPEVQLDASGWPQAASWPGMSKPLFDGSLGEFISVSVVPPATRSTISQLHGNPDRQKREAIRKTALRETAASYGSASSQETPYTLTYTQEIRHERLAQARRTVELWKREPRARVTIRFDRLSSVAPEVLFVAFGLPAGTPLPVFACGGVPFTPYRDQLGASCKDYFAIDGWAHYATGNGHWIWVTRDAPLVALGAPHVAELHETEPSNPNRILAMVFDNCWHTNFVADSHGTMEFQFELAWKQNIEKPADLAEALTAEPIVVNNPAVHETAPELNNLYRR
jgi:hypothetical protein